MGVDRALVKLGTWPDRFSEWIPFDSARLAPLGHMTSVHGKPVMPTAEPTMSQGTTAEISVGTYLDVMDPVLQAWMPAEVIDTADDGASIKVDGVQLPSAGWVKIDSGRIRMQSEPHCKPKPGMHRR